jgi:hypothetical protein
MASETLETLSGSLARHAELGADHPPRQPGTMGSEGSRFDTCIGFSPSGRRRAQLPQHHGISDDIFVIGVVVERYDDCIGLSHA